MKKGSKKSEKYVTEQTFEKSMRAVALSFQNQGQVLEMILKELKSLHEDHKNLAHTLASFAGDVSVHDRKISNLDVRVEKLELKSK